ncbi:hypothetical protein COLO4_28232 [Corchorus olitorius]|uniref:Retrotransposon Copia-like N-terminal domain-containing protein n=1 Tax=Corchorus olitorius TaxID=93759 RepID=A0A1R3HM95_9ROSI|nr:hypothetical protein COLO4_28232 [Corchorus olitorius]
MTTVTSSSSSSFFSTSNLISINSAAQLPIKLNTQNYPSWRAQFNSLLLGHKLLGFVDGSNKPPPATILSANDKETIPSTVSNPEYEIWFQQDQLLLHGIISSTTEGVIPFTASCQTSKQAWDKLTQMFANKSRSRMMSLTEKLA